MNRIRCMVCKSHWAVAAGGLYGNVFLYQCTNPACNDENGNPNHIGEKHEFSVPTRMLLLDTESMRQGLRPEFQFWKPEYKRPGPQKWSKPQYGDSDFDEDNPDGLFWSGS